MTVYNKLPALLRDYVEPVSEEGVTFTANPAAVLWPVRIASPHAKPMTCTIRATSAHQAHSFAAKRHPYATSILVGEPQDMMKPLRAFVPVEESTLLQVAALVKDGMSWPDAHKAAGIPAALAPSALRKRCQKLEARLKDPNAPRRKPAPAPAAKPKPKPAPVATDPALPAVLDILGKALQDAADQLRRS